MTISITKFSVFIAAMFLMIVASVWIAGSQKAYGSAIPGTQAIVATTSTPTVSATASIVFATSSTSCLARAISTASSSIMIEFTDKNGDVPSATKGFWQGSSTTVMYDGGQYGCDEVKIYSFATQQITVQETR